MFETSGKLPTLCTFAAGVSPTTLPGDLGSAGVSVAVGVIIPRGLLRLEEDKESLVEVRGVAMWTSSLPGASPAGG